MNFCRLRVINTIFLFLIGIMIGFYFASKKQIFKGIFGSSEYKPIYYGKRAVEDYKPVYIKTENKNSVFGNADFNIQNRSKEDKKFIEKIVNQNPIDDDYDFVLLGSSDLKQQDDNFTEINEFVKSPQNYTGKKISGRMILLKGDRTNGVNLYFLYGIGNQAFYIDIFDEDNLIKKFDLFRIGYYYNVTFLSKNGSLKNGNKLLSIDETHEKEPWASGIAAF